MASSISQIKEKNRGELLQLVCTCPHITRMEAARQTGLTKMTVSNLVGELIEEGFVCESAVSTPLSSAGRRPASLLLAPNSPVVLGVSMLRETLHLALFDLSLTKLEEQRFVLKNETRQSLQEKLTRHVVEMAANCQRRVLGIGIATIGPIDSETGTLLKPPNFFHISDFPIKQIVSDAIALPVFANNDMNAAALAETLFGTGKSLNNFIYIGITNGIGAGIIERGTLCQRGSGFVGEIGHMSLDSKGELCTCGNRGCLETYASMPVLLQRLKSAGLAVQSAKDLKALGSIPDAAPVLEDVACMLSIAIANTANLLNPQAVILGHDGVFLPDSIIEQIEQQVNRRILMADYVNIKIKRSAFLCETPLYGGACLVLNELFSGRLA